MTWYIEAMLPIQRRTIAACVFALSFILFYEARGQRLIAYETESHSEARALAVKNYSEQTGAGLFVLVLGALLIVTLRRKGQSLQIPRWELTVYALALGLLLGTAVVSWSVVARTMHGT
jgi:hypothetical protein